jgi:protein-L-isoaspartate(D-aspartate) O-methyltransferase
MRDAPQYDVSFTRADLTLERMRTLPTIFDGKRAIPSPECRALIHQMLQLGPSDKVLEIGTGSGTQTGEFGATGAEVHSIELEPWVDSTKIVGDCVFLHSGDGINGLPNHAPFTAIVATCGVEQIPKAWADQLGDGGRLVVPIGDSASQRLTIFRKEGSELVPVRVAAYVRFSMMRERPSPKAPKYQPDGQN